MKLSTSQLLIAERVQDLVNRARDYGEDYERRHYGRDDWQGPDDCYSAILVCIDDLVVQLQPLAPVPAVRS